MSDDDSRRGQSLKQIDWKGSIASVRPLNLAATPFCVFAVSPKSGFSVRPESVGWKAPE